MLDSDNNRVHIKAKVIGCLLKAAETATRSTETLNLPLRVVKDPLTMKAPKDRRLSAPATQYGDLIEQQAGSHHVLGPSTSHGMTSRDGSRPVPDTELIGVVGLERVH